ncbi:LPXTG cell wall anchor domain-containing protein [Loigolactobacillus backii]|uniref:Uncharacterized protein n=1 Tax=Loigolactobacillus backii TaxID=375175 RepID=A0A192H4I1_9LACO|nr:LPXTG cell wall anchor domain-containing protein [Loigolactobacillus backii]ANK62886.1 hypothetical protein AYR53_09015 [Loigolactobacillus backii]ANK70106.1 hypothetical protein AYR56_07990 [Loigolactobacillus backii]MDA5387234.1 LPXTG cell wall anchor domain-containing protein [Loigolactobacillus backii]MDA5389771.1 LPXTG cell wall anchor domain-containing protein [Loigolactobacillus backii]PIO83461.1 hypothetical protein BSQ39_07760 [Loigolactobacillus backii]
MLSRKLLLGLVLSSAFLVATPIRAETNTDASIGFQTGQTNVKPGGESSTNRPNNGGRPSVTDTAANSRTNQNALPTKGAHTQAALMLPQTSGQPTWFLSLIGVTLISLVAITSRIYRLKQTKQ